jgi:putative transposase
MPKPKFDPQRYHRRSIRLKEYDYSSEGAYFVTIVTWHRNLLFGDIMDGEMYRQKRKGAAMLHPNLRPNLLLSPWHVTKPILK